MFECVEWRTMQGSMVTQFGRCGVDVRAYSYRSTFLKLHQQYLDVHLAQYVFGN
jgi:beta-galactosidase beta subunit